MTEGIIDEILKHTETVLEDALITNVTADANQAGNVKIGPLQGDPDPDQARVAVEVHHNDPDNHDGNWRDTVVIVEIGGAATWSRKFTVKIRCLLDLTKENESEARSVSAIVKDRAELALLKEIYTGIATDDEYVSRGPMATSLKSEMLQGGGPPDSYDFHIKIYFDVWTTRTGIYS